MAKEKEDKKKGNEEELVEKPREPMFSTLGLILLLGSNVVVAGLIVVGFMALGPSDSEDNAPDSGTSMLNQKDADFLKLEGMQTTVSGIGNEKAMVRFDILIGFSGGPSEQTEMKTYYTQGSRDDLLKYFAQERMGNYSISSVEDSNFAQRFGEDLKEDYNAAGHPKIAVVLLVKKSVQRR